MRRAIELAKKGGGYVHPNPLVGCVVVKDGEIIAEGYHEKYGEFHAERNALLHCQSETKGASLYVTLEPCCHYGKTPPCTEIIIEKVSKRSSSAYSIRTHLWQEKVLRFYKMQALRLRLGFARMRFAN